MSKLPPQLGERALDHAGIAQATSSSPTNVPMACHRYIRWTATGCLGDTCVIKRPLPQLRRQFAHSLLEIIARSTSLHGGSTRLSIMLRALMECPAPAIAVVLGG